MGLTAYRYGSASLYYMCNGNNCQYSKIYQMNALGMALKNRPEVDPQNEEQAKWHSLLVIVYFWGLKY